MKRCYYEVLEVDRKATPAEIKTNYRKMALKYHPDKNSEDGAKERFVEINEAYNVLSDPNERTWYDNNREKLLFNKEEMSKEDVDQYTFGFNIWHYFTTGCFNGYDDGPTAFYAVYRDVFEKIKTEETKAYSLRDDIQEDQRKLEGFGDSTTSEDRVLKFYEDWQNFATYKTFVWSEEWDTREAGSRWVRRQMEKENKKQRQGEKKNYVKTIKDLLAYVRKRDPRFIAYVAKLKQQEEKKQQERIQREKEKLKEKEEMKHVKQRLEEERFREIEEYYRQQNAQTINNPVPAPHPHPYKQEHQSEFYCEICEKEFKSENQLRNHQKSKQHKQMVKDIEKEVLLKEQMLQRAKVEEEEQQTKQETSLPKQPEEKEEEEQASPKKKRNKKKKNQQKKEESSEQETVQTKEQTKPPTKAESTKQPAKKEQKPQSKQQQKSQPQPKVDSSSDDEDHFMNTLLGNRNKQQTKIPVQQPPQPAQKDKKKAKVEESESDEEEREKKEQKQQQLNKAKLKKQKKAQQQKAGKGTELKCKTCEQVFPSKTKLFQHINKTGHASAK